MSDVFLKMFGVCIGFSVLRIFLRQNFVKQTPMTKIGIGFFAFHAVQINIFENFFVNWILVYASIVLIFLFVKLYSKNLETQFSKEFPAILTSLILNMKLGQSFRQSLRLSFDSVSARWRPWIAQIYDDVVFSTQENGLKRSSTGAFLKEISQEFIKMDRSNHKTIEKIENFRRRLIIIEKFRRRSGRIRGQVRLQIILMSIIYAGVFAINGFMFPMGEYKILIAMSVLTYILGLLMVFAIGKRIRWNI